MFVKKSLYFDEPVVVRKKNKAAFKNRSEEAKKEGNKNATQSIHSRARNSRAFFLEESHSVPLPQKEHTQSTSVLVLLRIQEEEEERPRETLSQIEQAFLRSMDPEEEGEGGGAQKAILVAKETEFHQTKVRDIFF